jgi:hypothetical protein
MSEVSRIAMSQNPSSIRSTRAVSGWTRMLVALALLLVRAAPVAAQLYTLAPPPYQTVLNNAGAPVSNACVWTYSAGTTTPIATYSDNVGTVNTNPIRTDPAGRFTAYLVPGTGYKFVYELPCTPPAHGVVLRTADNVAGTPTASIVTTGTWIPSLGGTATYTAREGTYVRVGALVFARGAMAVATLGTGSPFLLSGLPVPLTADAVGAVIFIGAAAVPFTRVSLYAQGGGTTLGLVGLSAAGVVEGYLNLFTDGAVVRFNLTYQTTAP